MFFQRIFTPGLAINSYLLGDEKTKKCAVVDPTRHVVPLIVQAQNAGFEISYVIETHVHADYVSGAKELKHQLNEQPLIYASGMGGAQWIPRYTDVVVEKGTQIEFGDLRLEAVHAPGHTPEHIIWLCYDQSRSVTTPWFVLTGDSLFVGSVGRPDLLGAKEMDILAPELYTTIFDVLGGLPDFVEIFPAHGQGSLCGKGLKSRGSSTIGYERRFNPYFKHDSLEHWVNHLIEGLSAIPPYFPYLKKINVEGPPLLSTLKTHMWDQKNSPDIKELFLLDVRHQESFAFSYLPGSLNIPYSHSFTHWAGWMVPNQTPIGLIVENSHLYSEVIDQLRLMGFDQEIWVIELLQDGKNDFCTFSSFPFIQVEDVAHLSPDFNSLFLLDVRTPEEWCVEHIPGAHHIELNDLEHHLDQIPIDQTIAIVCRSGQRASLAASLLLKHGFPLVNNIRGGIQMWKQAGLPLVSELK
ncbi:MAG: rhodanese-like domain-containing protein [Parachlamydiaceae bacterium]